MGGLARFLGRPAVAVDGRQVEVPAGRRGALWLYIVYQQRWVDRSELTFLLWPDSEQRRANANLRQLMVAVSRTDWGCGLERERRRTRCRIDTDVTAFTAAADAQRWDDALTAYTGTFLDGFALDDAPEFMDWLELERAAIHDRWRSISLSAIDRWLTSGLPHDALVLAERLLAHDPLDEDAARRAMQAAHAGGEERRALLVYEALRTGLRREIGLEPTPDTTALARRIVEEANAGDRADVDVPEPLPVREEALASRFIGRERELDELALAVTGDRSRLVSVVAPAGMGKTWLVRALEPRVRAAFAGGSVFVRLDDAVGRHAVAHAIAGGLGARLTARSEPGRQLITVIGDRELLVILDGFEAHVGAHALLTALLDGCPRLTLLVTSRVRLQHSEERVYELGGLGVTAFGHEAIEAPSESCRLFLRAAQRVLGPGGAESLDGADVGAICRTLGGWPLAIDLCASWLAIAPIADVRERLASSWDLLHADDVDRPLQHRDIRSILGETWRGLTDHDRSVWKRLAVLRGSFDHELAARVSGTTWSELLRLKRYTLVRSVGSRLEMHALVARFGREAAEATGETERVAALMGAYFGEKFVSLGRMRPLHVDDLPHLAAAWHHAVSSSAFDLVAAMAVGMQRSFVAVGRSDEATRSCDEAVTILAAATGRERDVALARVLCGASSRHGAPPDRARLALALAKAHGDLLGRAIAHASLALGQPLPEARFHHRHAKVLFHRARDPAGLIDTCLRFGRRVCLSGYYAEAEAIFDEARARAIAIAARVDEAEAIARLADVSTLTGDLPRAEAQAHEAWELFGSAGAPLRALTCVGTLLWVARIRRDVAEARRWTAVYLAWQEETGRGAGVEAALVRSHLSYLLRRYDEAWEGAGAVMRLVGEGSTGLVADRTRLWMARIALRGGDVRGAVELVRAVLRPHLVIERPRHTVDATVVASELAAWQGFDALAVELLQAALTQPAMDADARLEASEVARAHGWDVKAAAVPAPLDDLVERVHAILDLCS